MCLAVPGKIESIIDNDPLARTAKVNFGGTIREVNLTCVPEANVGDYVLVHVGMAISTIDETEANLVFQYLREMEELADSEESGK
jgi:hydrogenase expression/formation protein HypC